MAPVANRRHDRTSFFKYMTAATARAVLSTRTLRWSSPLLFNDPFDTPRELAFGLAPADVSRAIAQRLASMIQCPPDDTSGLEPRVRLMVEVAKRGIAPEVKAELVAAISDTSALPTPPSGSLDDLRAVWRAFVPDFRILCLTEDPGSASMWNHYAGGYSGAVLELECRAELDSAWLAARPVTYARPAAEMFSADEMAQLLMMPRDGAQHSILDWATFRKAPEWNSEREWRVVTSRRASDSGHFSDYPFHPLEVAAIYLGPRISQADRDALVVLSRALPSVRLIQVEIGMGQGFRYEKVGG